MTVEQRFFRIERLDHRFPDMPLYTFTFLSVPEDP